MKKRKALARLVDAVAVDLNAKYLRLDARVDGLQAQVDQLRRDRESTVTAQTTTHRTHASRSLRWRT